MVFDFWVIYFWIIMLVNVHVTLIVIIDESIMGCILYRIHVFYFIEVWSENVQTVYLRTVGLVKNYGIDLTMVLGAIAELESKVLLLICLLTWKNI